MKRIVVVTLALTALTSTLTGCSSCTGPAPAGEGEGEGEGVAGEGEGAPGEGEGEGGGEGEGEGAGEGEGEGGGEGEGEGSGEGEGEGGGVVTEHVIAGGGVADAPIVDTLFVHVADVVTGNAVSGATVAVDLGGNTSLSSSTDANGLATFTTGITGNPVDITVSGTGIRNTTWLGVDGENVTIPVITASSNAPGNGQLHLSLDASQFTVHSGNFLNVFATFSEADGSLSQPGDALVQSNILRCTTKLLAQSQCSQPFNMESPPGKRTVLATLVEMQPGSGIGSQDTVVGVAGYAIAKGLTVTSGQTTNATLTQVVATQTGSVTFPAISPAGFGTDVSFINLDVGVDNGGVAGSTFPLVFGQTTSELVASLDDSAVTPATYEVVGLLVENGAAPGLSASFSYQVNDVTAFTLPAWLFPPTAITVTDNGLSVSYTPPNNGSVQATSFHTIELKNGGDHDINPTVWTVVVLDGRTTIHLPSSAPNPLANGTDGVRVTPAVVTGFNPQSFDFPTASQALTLVSTDGVTFTHN